MSSSEREKRRLVELLRAKIPVDEFEFSFARSRGPGGQNVNKVNTRVTLRFDFAGSTALTALEKRTIRAKLAGRVTRDGHLRVVSMRHRTQRANRVAATTRFYELLAETLARPKPRRPTKIPRAAREKRLADKRVRGRRKQMRSARSIED